MKNLIKWFLKGWGKEFQEDFSEIPGFPGFPGGEMKFQENSRSSRFSRNPNNPDKAALIVYWPLYHYGKRAPDHESYGNDLFKLTNDHYGKLPLITSTQIVKNILHRTVPPWYWNKK